MPREHEPRFLGGIPIESTDDEDAPDAGGDGVDDLPGTTEVIVTDITMPFGSMVTFMVKWAIASIPALLILGLLGFAIVGWIAAAARLVR